jgi:iron complex outermembrane receptor protein
MSKATNRKSALVAFAVSMALGSIAWAEGLAKIDVPAGDLIAALESFSKQSGVELVFQPEQVRGLRTQGVNGTLSSRDAVQRLLEGTPLRLKIDEKTGAMMIGPAQPSAATSMSSGEIQLASTEVTRQPELAEVTVSANYVPETNNSAAKMDISLLETPQSVSVITRDQIELLNWQTIEQAVRYTSGIVGGMYGDDGRGDWLFLRGFKPTTYLDGLQLPAGSFAFSRMDLGALESVEILKGPSSGLYGAVPPGGLVNMVSRRPQREFGAQFGVQAGSYDHLQASGAVTGPLDAERTLLFRLGSVYQDSSSIVALAPDNRRLMVQPSLTWQPNDRFSVTLLSHFQDDDMGVDQQFLPEIGTALPNPNGQLPRSTYVSDPGYDLFKRDEYHVGYVLDFRVSDRLELHQAVRRSDIDADTRMLYGAGYFEDAEQRMLARYLLLWDENANNLSTDTALQLDFGTGAVAHKLLAGVDHRESNGSYSFGFDLGPSLDLYDPAYGLTFGDVPLYSRPDRDETQTGIYLQDHAKIANWVFTGTLRHDEYDSETLQRLTGTTSRFDQKATTGRFGVNYVFDAGISPYVSYSKSFQPQSGFDGITGKPFVPTTGVQYEAGVKYQPQGRSGLVSLIAYDLRQQNVPTPIPTLPFAQRQAGEVQVKGIELEGVARLNDAFSINGAYSYTDAAVSESGDPAELGTKIALVPKHQASVLVDYTLRLPSGSYLGFGGGVRYQGEAYGSPGNLGIMTANTQVDALFRYGKGPWRFTLNVNNLFDLKYLSTCDGYGNCWYGYSRTVMGTLTREWGK